MGGDHGHPAGAFSGLRSNSFYLWLSVLHGVLAQSFFLITIMIAYGLSAEYQRPPDRHRNL